MLCNLITSYFTILGKCVKRSSLKTLIRAIFQGKIVKETSEDTGGPEFLNHYSRASSWQRRRWIDWVFQTSL